EVLVELSEGRTIQPRSYPVNVFESRDEFVRVCYPVPVAYSQQGRVHLFSPLEGRLDRIRRSQPIVVVTVSRQRKRGEGAGPREEGAREAGRQKARGVGEADYRRAALLQSLNRIRYPRESLLT